MHYGISELSALSGVSVRMLRHYDEIGLLTPQRAENGYRRYGDAELRRLQQILFFREMEFPLDEIHRIIDAPDYDAAQALATQRERLASKRERIDRLIESVDKALLECKGVYAMKDRERFEAFKKDLVDQNEAKYGEEIRQKYGDAKVDESNARMMNLTPEQYERMQDLQAQITNALIGALQSGDPAGETAQNAVQLHRQWLSLFGHYPDEAYLGLCDMYVQDPRFTAYYDESAGKGAAQMLRDAAFLSLGREV